MKGKTKVLIFIDWYLPGFRAGGPIRSCANLVERLKQYYDFYIITRNTDYTAVTPYTTVTSDSWNEANGTQVYYLSKPTLKSGNIRKLIQEVNPDVVYINGIYSFYFSILPIILSKQMGYRNILVAGRGMLAQSAIHVKGLKKKLFFKLANFFKLYRGVVFHATNPEEAMDIRAAVSEDVAIKVAPNLPEALPVEEKENVERIKEPGILHLVSIARIAPEKNTGFALEVLQRFKGQGKIKLDLYGPVYNQAYWEECKAIIAQMPATISVAYKGSLEKEKVHETLQQYHALFMPSKGENFGHIILESLTAGCPVLISDQTPWRNLGKVGVGYDLPLNDIPAYLAALTELLQLNREQFNFLSDKAFNYAAAYRQDEKHLEANRALFEFE